MAEGASEKKIKQRKPSYVAFTVNLILSPRESRLAASVPQYCMCPLLKLSVKKSETKNR